MPKRIRAPGPPRKHFIKEWREFMGLTQAQLASRVDTTAKNLSQIETLAQGYTQSSLEAIAEVFGQHPAVLLTRPPDDRDRIPPSPTPGAPSARRRH